jgi:hypothetical protein
MGINWLTCSSENNLFTSQDRCTGRGYKEEDQVKDHPSCPVWRKSIRRTGEWRVRRVGAKCAQKIANKQVHRLVGFVMLEGLFLCNISQQAPFYSEGFLVPHSKPKLEDDPLLAVFYCLDLYVLENASHRTEHEIVECNMVGRGTCLHSCLCVTVRGYIQKFPDWPPGARTANGTAFCH